MPARQPAGIPTGGQFTADAQPRAAIALDEPAAGPQSAATDAELVAAIEHGKTLGVAGFNRADLPEGMITTSDAVDRLTATGIDRQQATAIIDARQHDILATDRDNRIVSVMSTEQVDTLVAILDPSAPKPPTAGPRPVSAAELGRTTPGRLAKQAREMLNEQKPDEAPSTEKPITDLTGRESATLRGLPTSQVAAVADKLRAGPAEGFRATGPTERAMILGQIGDGPLGNVAAISGGRVIPLPDGVELPVSNGVKVRVRLAGNDTYTVQRIRVRGATEKLLGERIDIYAEDLAEIAYRAGMYRSYDGPEEW
jgi:hypothetical protein